MNRDAALTIGRQAATILEAPPDDPVAGYTDNEIAAQYAATDRLLAAFRQLDEEGCSENEHPPHEKERRK